LAGAWFDDFAFSGARRAGEAFGRAGTAGPVDAGDLAARVAGVVLSLATGPHRVQEKEWEESTRRRLDVVEHWVARAQSG
jgi:hypothetical protein